MGPFWCNVDVLSLYLFQVGNETLPNMTHCLCNHLTFFSSVVVKPNPIGPLTLKDLEEGYALFVAVGVVFLLYFVGLVWARRKDRVDLIKVILTADELL